MAVFCPVSIENCVSQTTASHSKQVSVEAVI